MFNLKTDPLCDHNYKVMISQKKGLLTKDNILYAFARCSKCGRKESFSRKLSKVR